MTTDTPPPAPATLTASLLLELRAILTEETMVEHPAHARDAAVVRRLAPAVRLVPTAAILRPGASAAFTATVRDAGDEAVTWSATGGTLAGTGRRVTYTAGDRPGRHAITATSVADPSRRATVRIVIIGG